MTWGGLPPLLAAFRAWACTAAATEATPATVAAALAADMAAEEAAWASWAAWRRVVAEVEARDWVVEWEWEEGEMTGEVARSKPREEDRDLRPCRGAPAAEEEEEEGAPVEGKSSFV